MIDFANKNKKLVVTLKVFQLIKIASLHFHQCFYKHFNLTLACTINMVTAVIGVSRGINYDSSSIKAL